MRRRQDRQARQSLAAARNGGRRSPVVPTCSGAGDRGGRVHWRRRIVGRAIQDAGRPKLSGITMAQNEPETVSTDQLLLHAASTGGARLALAALNEGASPDCRDPHGNTPLMRAATYGEAGMVKLLVDAGADLNVATEYGVTALMKAAIHDRTGAAKQLLMCGADGSLRDCDGLTAKEIAVRLGNGAVAAVL